MDLEIMKMLQYFFERLNSYSNLILALITLAYVALTRKMVVEMKKARESESDSELVVMLIPLGINFAKLRIANVGGGPALRIKTNIILQSVEISKNKMSIWKHPVLLPKQYEDFHFPNGEKDLRNLSDDFDALTVEMEWYNLLNTHKKASFKINLKEQYDGWSQSRLLPHSEDIPYQLESIKNELAHILEFLKGQDFSRTTKEFAEQVKEKTQKRQKKKRKLS